MYKAGASSWGDDNGNMCHPSIHPFSPEDVHHLAGRLNHLKMSLFSASSKGLCALSPKHFPSWDNPNWLRRTRGLCLWHLRSAHLSASNRCLLLITCSSHCSHNVVYDEQQLCLHLQNLPNTQFTRHCCLWKLLPGAFFIHQTRHWWCCMSVMLVKPALILTHWSSFRLALLGCRDEPLTGRNAKNSNIHRRLR